MATTANHSIYYPTSGDPVTPLESVFATQASSVDTALTNSSTRRIGTQSQRLAISGIALKAGLSFYQTDGVPGEYVYNGSVWMLDGILTGSVLPTTANYPGRQFVLTTTNRVYVYTGGAWSALPEAPVLGLAYRSGSAPTIPAGTYTNIASSASWATTEPQGYLTGGVTYSSGWTLPTAGYYEVGFTLITTAGGSTILAGYMENATSVDSFTNLIAYASSNASVGGISGTGIHYFQAGTVLRLFAYSSSGSPSVHGGNGTRQWVKKVRL